MKQSWWVGVCAMLVVLLGGLAATPVSAARPDAAGERHCVMEALGVNENGSLEMGPERCFATEAEADAFAGIGGVSGLFGGPVALGGSYNLAKHYTGLSYSGSSITVVGSVLCGGGTHNWTGSSWDNDFESAKSYCGGPAVRHYDASSCSGTNYSVTGNSPNLGSLNNKTSCTKYG